MLGRLPKALRPAWVDRPDAGENAAEAVEAIRRFVRGVLNAVAPHAACVKFQSACFERYLWPGVKAYHELMEEARNLGLIVIADPIKPTTAEPFSPNSLEVASGTPP